MDPSAEIDDEILAHVIMKQETSNTDVFFVCVPGITAEHDPSDYDIKRQVHDRVQRMRDVFPERFGNQDTWRPDTKDPDSSLFTLCSYDDFQRQAASRPLRIDTLLHVAPLWHIRASTLAVFDIQERIFMGDLTDPAKSINGTKAMFNGPDGDNLRAEFARQETTFARICKQSLFIPTSFARKVPTPIAFINGLPDTMKEPLLKTAFAQFVGRPDPALPWAEDISRVNHATILNMLSVPVREEIVATRTPNGQVTAFLKGKHECPEYHLRLAHIAEAVKRITRVEYDGTGFHEGALTDPVRAKQNWSDFIRTHNCNLTPFYDGLAWIVMNEPRGDMPTVARCNEIILHIA